MPDYELLPSRTVLVSDRVGAGTAHLPPEYFEGRDLRPGHMVVVRKDGTSFKVTVKSNEMLKSTEIAITPRLAIVLMVSDGDSVEVLDRYSLDERVIDRVDSFVDFLGRKAEGLKRFLSEDLDRFVDRTVKEALDALVDRRAASEDPLERRGYLEVPPNPDDFGIDREEICEDESLRVREWSPDTDGDGKVRVFRPEGDED